MHTPGPWTVDSDPEDPENGSYNRRSQLYSERYPTTPAIRAALAAGDTARASLAEALEALRSFANIAEYRDLREGMANVLRPHEREGFLAAMANARAVLARNGR
jgi:hypothetical protein